MTKATLSEVLVAARNGGYAVAGLVVLGWEDARAFVRAAEAVHAPVILQAGPGFRKHTPLPVICAMFDTLAAQAAVPVVTHFDHGHTVAECLQAIELGFSSVMYDGSRLPLAQNIVNTNQVLEAARAKGVSVEGELGYVGYPNDSGNRLTDPEEARYYCEQCAVHALAISIGNTHLQTESTTRLDQALLTKLEAATTVPLVIHGGSGIELAQRSRIARTTRICKFNIGTELRQCFGYSLRRYLQQHPQEFDRLKILSASEAAMQVQAEAIIRSLFC